MINVSNTVSTLLVNICTEVNVLERRRSEDSQPRQSDEEAVKAAEISESVGEYRLMFLSWFPLGVQTSVFRPSGSESPASGHN